MNALVRKEFRLILPAWSVALVALIAARVNFGLLPNPSEWIILSFCVGMLVLGLTPFGREFASGSFSLLLAQPFPRGGLWQAKIRHWASAALTLFVLFTFLWLSQTFVNGAPSWDVFGTVACTGLAVLTGGLWTTLLLRQITAAFWITMLVPFVLALGVSLVTEWLVLRLANILPAAATDPERVVPFTINAVFVFYSIAGYWWARRLFLQAQDVGWAVAEAPVPGFARLFKVRTRPVDELTHRPLHALAVKEFQLHSLSLFFATGVLVLHLAAIGVRKFGSESGGWREAAYLIWALWFILPFIVGAEAVASERQLGTMEGQLCLPARRRTQFACKLLFTLLAGIVLGGVMPWLLENFASSFGVGAEVLKKFYTEHSVWEQSSLAVLMGWSAIAGGMALMAFHASTLTRSTLQAMGGAVMGWIVVWVLILFGARPEVLCKTQLWRGWLFHWIGGLTLVPVVIGLAYWNFKRLHHARQLWRRNLIVLGVWLVLLVSATGAIYHRTWELVTPLEPQHGPARVSSIGRVELCSVAERVFILLPDGRLWATTKNARMDGAVLAGEFVGGSNWTAVAATHSQAAAVQADGRLWAVFGPLRGWSPGEQLPIAPRQIGTDSDWKSVSARGGHFLALKQDGSVWGWGDNSYKQLGEGPKQFTNGPVRIGDESDWVAVFASAFRSAAVKRDGSVWMWGSLSYLPDGTRPKQVLREPTPMRWSLPGTNLITLRSYYWGDLAFYGDGSIQLTGHIPPGLRGGLGLKTEGMEEDEDWRESVPLAITPIHVNPAGGWRAIELGRCMLTVHGDGSLWKQPDWWTPGNPGQLKKPSDYSDWLAATLANEAILALAADGTLCCWSEARPQENPRALLGPTRRPLWSLNILDPTD